MKVIAVIPSRWASTLLPGKPLADICGKPMIQRVYERVKAAKLCEEAVVATDNAKIRDTVTAFGGIACMTSEDCASGTDRLIETAAEWPADIYVNVQGDEPLIDPASIDLLIRAMLDDPELEMATLCHPVSTEEAQDPNLVKVVRAANGNALYFSRSPIPYPRKGGVEAKYYGHLGIYAYRRSLLMGFGELPWSPLENTEKLEQLRVLEAGKAIRVLEVASAARGVDTPEDLEAVRAAVRAAEA